MTSIEGKEKFIQYQKKYEDLIKKLLLLLSTVQAKANQYEYNKVLSKLQTLSVEQLKKE